MPCVHYNESMAQPKKFSLIHSLKHVAALAFAVVITIFIILFQDKLRHLGGLTYIGAFIVMLVGNATLVLPAPALLFVYALGGQLNPLLVGLFAGAGGALGEFVGYLAGYSGSHIVERTKMYKKIHGYVTRFGLPAITILAMIPNPFFDIVGMVAGALKITWWKFLIAAFIGIALKATIIAYAGYYSITWIGEIVAK